VTWGCEYPSTNHSDDIVEVWHGETEPAVLCGFHATFPPADLWDAVRARRLAEHATPLDAIPNDLED
jgi:hypothetical protein